jgi:hypothetical protein
MLGYFAFYPVYLTFISTTQFILFLILYHLSNKTQPVLLLAASHSMLAVQATGRQRLII